MKYLFILLLAFGLQAQQLNHTQGVQTPSGAAWDGSGLGAYIDTTAGTTNNIIVDLNDFFLQDIFPTVTNTTGDISVSGDSVYAAALYSNSTRLFLGTFYTFFDNVGTKSPTTDTLLYTIKVYPGVYSTASKSISGVKWGTAVTLQTMTAIRGDYLAVNNVYIHASAVKPLPPEVIKLEIAPASKNTAKDDSTLVHWDYVYPAIHQVYKERK